MGVGQGGQEYRNSAQDIQQSHSCFLAYSLTQISANANG